MEEACLVSMCCYVDMLIVGCRFEPRCPERTALHFDGGMVDHPGRTVCLWTSFAGGRHAVAAKKAGTAQLYNCRIAATGSAAVVAGGSGGSFTDAPWVTRVLLDGCAVSGPGGPPRCTGWGS